MAKQLVYQVCLGEVPEFYHLCIDSVRSYCRRHNYDHIVQTEPHLKIAPLKSARSENALRLGYLPIYEKENAFSYLGDYESVAIVDADIYVRDTAPDIFEAASFGPTPRNQSGNVGPVDFAGVLERDMPLTQVYADKVRKHSQGQFSTLKDVDWDWDNRGAAYYNMGMMVLNQSILEYLNGETPEQFIRRREFERFVNGEGHWRWSTDQTLLNYWVKASGMKTHNLDWRWNGLFGAVQDVSEAFFVHFFLSAKLPRKGAEIPQIIARL